MCMTNHFSFQPKSFKAQPFKPPFWLKNPHIQTILPKFLVKYQPNYRRELIKDALGESQIAYDFVDVKDEKIDGKYQKPLVILFHGLEGSSNSHYAKSLAKAVKEQDWHYVVVHFRSCGGIPAMGNVFYNAGDTSEMQHAMIQLGSRYQHLYAVGMSLGGNVLAKYMGEQGDKAACQAAAVVSAPVDLASSAIAMERLMGRRIYTPYLLNPLVKKALENSLSSEEMQAVCSSTRISEFDQIFTAPRHGYRSVNDYYRHASSLPYLIDITKPTIIITAKDDPFLGMTACDTDLPDAVLLLETEHGGHMGYLRYLPHHSPKLNVSWLPDTVVGFFNSQMTGR